MQELTPEQLREMSAAGAEAVREHQRIAEEARRAEQERADVAAARKLIDRADGAFRRAAERGEREVRICRLISGRHYSPGFYQEKSPQLLRTFGYVLYEYFTQKGFEVEFRYDFDQYNGSWHNLIIKW